MAIFGEEPAATATYQQKKQLHIIIRWVGRAMLNIIEEPAATATYQQKKQLHIILLWVGRAMLFRSKSPVIPYHQTTFPRVLSLNLWDFGLPQWLGALLRGRSSLT